MSNMIVQSPKTRHRHKTGRNTPAINTIDDSKILLRNSITSNPNSDDDDNKGAVPTSYTKSIDTHHHQQRNIITIAIGPAALLGGTAAIYSAALKHSSSTLTPLSVIYLLLLAIQYSIQPRISKKYVNKQTNKQSVAMVEEIAKASMAASILAGGSLVVSGGTNINGNNARGSLSTILNEWTLSESLMVAGMPSVLYAIQGVLTYTAYQNVDSVTFNGLSQTKMLSAAFCTWLIMGKVQSKVQIIALILLFTSALIFQGTVKSSTLLSLSSNPKKVISNLFNGGVGKKENQQKSHQESSISSGKSKNYFIYGIVPCLLATFISGLAGAFSQKGLQLAGGVGRDPYLYTVEVSVYSAICLIISMILNSKKNSGDNDVNNNNKENNNNKTTSFFKYWNIQTLIPVLVKAFGGLLTALVHKHAGSVVKGFALVLGLVMSGIIQTIVDDKDLSVDQIFGTCLVMLSSWLHFTNPP